MADIRITKEPGNWVVRIDGSIVGESTRALRLSEGRLADVIYLPREDIGMEFFDPSDHRTTCPHKGEASYFHFDSPQGRVENVAWSYETPKDGVAEIAGHLAFYDDKALVEEL